MAESPHNPLLLARVETRACRVDWGRQLGEAAEAGYSAGLGAEPRAEKLRPIV